MDGGCWAGYPAALCRLSRNQGFLPACPPLQLLMAGEIHLKSQFLIAAPHSGAGKTTVTLGLLRAIANSGKIVQPFKCGPDYIDPFHHRQACARPSYNLDSYMGSAEHVRDIYALQLANADVAIVEGVMGLFDGANRSEGSSAEIAQLLNLPIILVVKAQAMAYSAAALLFGFSRFNPKLNIAGVLFNEVGSESHYNYLRIACEDVGLTPLGYLPRNPAITVPSRHLGLCISDEHDYDAMIDTMAEHVASHIDIEALLKATSSPEPTPRPAPPVSTTKNLTIAVAQDAAFNFIYPQNLRVLEQLGKVITFSPLEDSELPQADLIYLAGGYPELHLQQLSQNLSLHSALRDYCAQGGRMIAECGGMMLMSHTIIDKDGRVWPMAGVLDQDVSLAQMKLHLGYRCIELETNNIAPLSLSLRGHEFHYSCISRQGNLDNIAHVKNARDAVIETPVWRHGNLLASYIHFYWGEDGALPRWLLQQPLTEQQEKPRQH